MQVKLCIRTYCTLEDYINEDWNPSLIEPLNRMKVELEKQEQSLLSNRNYVKITHKG